MQRVKAKRRLRAEAWPVMVSRFAGSGMTAEAFSQQQRVSLASLNVRQPGHPPIHEPGGLAQPVSASAGTGVRSRADCLDYIIHDSDFA